jgi:hypothetical protein
MDQSKMKAVYTIVERGEGKSYWTRIGVAFENRDGSYNLKLDALPVNGQLQMREYEPKEKEDQRVAGRNAGGNGGNGGRRDYPHSSVG